MRMLKGPDGSCYFFLQLPFNKGIEFGWQRVPPDFKKGHFDLYFRLNFRGCDHAGLKTHIEIFGRLFEFSITDHRHWDYKNDMWQDPDAVLDCDAGRDSVFLHGGEPNEEGLGSTYYKDE